MNEKELLVCIGEKTNIYSDIVILVPSIALEEAGFIKTFSTQKGSHAKHEYHAMSQMAYYQYQDEELDITVTNEKMIIEHSGSSEELLEGVVIYRDVSGSIHVLSQEGQNVKKLIESAYRFCARWVRLDI